MSGTLYIVATPIGNLADISQRVADTLGKVDHIYAEDTRVTLKLLAHLGVSKPLTSLHDHNEVERIATMIGMLQQGQALALVSDAGTPLISDPGYHLVRAVRAAGLRVVPIPGASAVITALSAAGVATDRFTFEGFLPAKASARRSALAALKTETRTLVFYESSHRIIACLLDIAAVFEPEREVVIARELTKLYETFYQGSAQQLVAKLREHPNHQRGEFVIMLAGTSTEVTKAMDSPYSLQTLMSLLLEEGLSVRQVAKIAARLSGQAKNILYRQALVLSSTGSADDVDSGSDSA